MRKIIDTLEISVGVHNLKISVSFFIKNKHIRFDYTKINKENFKKRIIEELFSNITFLSYLYKTEHYQRKVPVTHACKVNYNNISPRKRTVQEFIKHSVLHIPNANNDLRNTIEICVNESI